MGQIALVGIYPPPIGGISVHIKRLQHLLAERGIDCVVYDVGARESKSQGVIPVPCGALLLFRLFFSKERIVHYHGHSWQQRAMFLLLKVLSKRVIFTFHSFRDEVQSFGLFKHLLVRMVVRLGDYFIAVGPHVRDKLVSIGVKADRVVVIPDFLPPQVEKRDFEAIPAYVWSFIDSHTPIITANAFRISFYQGKDLYGIDMCVDLCAALKQVYPDVGLVFCLPDIGDRNYFAELQARIKHLGIEDKFLFVNETIALSPILTRSDLFMRPTIKDGYGISVAESLYLGTPAVASDVCERAPGAILFRSGDLDNLHMKVREVLDDCDAAKQFMEDHRPPNLFDRLLSVYQTVAGQQLAF